MLAKRIIPCLDVKNGVVVKGVQFRNHTVVGDIIELAKKYCDDGADEIVFYDITASSDHRTVSYQWIDRVASILDIPFCVAGGIRDVGSARRILNAGADKISINSPALESPRLVSDLAETFGSQCVVVGIDSYEEDGNYFVYQYTGDPDKAFSTKRTTEAWIKEVQTLGAGEIVLNCMNQDGMRQGYDIFQLKHLRKFTTIPLIASGGAGIVEDFKDVFEKTNVDGALAASVFHQNHMSIQLLKKYLKQNGVEVRL